MKIIFRNLAYNKFRTFLSISGIAVAVISIILIGSIGNGLLLTGEKTLERSSMQIWLTGKMVDIQSQFAGGTEGKITDSHNVAAKLLENSNIIWARPVLTEILYVYKEGNEPKAVFGLGVATTGSGKDFVSVIKGKGLIEDTNYNNGMFNGERQDEVMIDERAARLLGINIDDTIYIGKTLTEAKNQKFKVVGITNSLSSFTPGSMVIFYLSELQEMTGNQ
ncbi:MAG: ABC transporter permease, partial [Candidatus Methanoperedens sp.]|nr:ABC transporter permease [Candidatus Methanoperedens sp.]